MNKKEVVKKLSLNKRTLSNLTNKKMSDVKAGLFYTDPRACDTNYQCSDFTWNGCPRPFISNYEWGCCTQP
jgi:hypothetical protein